MDTLYWLIQPTGHIETGSKDLAKQPSFNEFAFIAPLLRCAHFEHVSVLFEGEPRDMFVDEVGALTSRPINPLATVLYHQNTMWRHLSVGHPLKPGDLTSIHGPAIFFPTRRVWF